MSVWCWLVDPCGRGSPRMLAREAAGWFGATDAAAVALTAGNCQAGGSVRVGELGGRGAASGLNKERLLFKRGSVVP
eukprot:3794768-Pyramimonas_sp.AAC.1